MDRTLSDDADFEWFIIFKLCRKVKYGRTDIYDKGCHGQKSVTGEDLIQQMDQVVQERWMFTITKLFKEFPEISGSSIYTIITSDSLWQSRNQTTVTSVDAHKFSQKTKKVQHHYSYLGPKRCFPCWFHGTRESNQCECLLSDIAKITKSHPK